MVACCQHVSCRPEDTHTGCTACAPLHGCTSCSESRAENSPTQAAEALHADSPSLEAPLLLDALTLDAFRLPL